MKGTLVTMDALSTVTNSAVAAVLECNQFENSRLKLYRWTEGIERLLGRLQRRKNTTKAWVFQLTAESEGAIETVGANVGARVGILVGAGVGGEVGEALGETEGLEVGVAEGETEGDLVGTSLW